MKRKPRDTTRDYIDNKKFSNAVIEYVTEVKKLQEEQGLERPKDVSLKPNDYIGDCIMKICNGLSYRPNFINYSYRDEFCFDGQLACIKALKNFNPIYGNAFGYFTQIAFRAFITRIKLEKKQQVIRHRLMLTTDIDSVIDDSVKNSSAELSSDIINVYKSIAVSKLTEDDLKDFTLKKKTKDPQINESPLTAFL